MGRIQAAPASLLILLFFVTRPTNAQWPPHINPNDCRFEGDNTIICPSGSDFEYQGGFMRLEADLICPADIVQQNGIVLASQQRACSCETKLQDSAGNFVQEMDCQCLLCPSNARFPTAYTCTTPFAGTCSSFDCNGDCNSVFDPPTFPPVVATASPSQAPTTFSPTTSPSTTPSQAPTTPAPTNTPSSNPSDSPSNLPSTFPTYEFMGEAALDQNNITLINTFSSQEIMVRRSNNTLVADKQEDVTANTTFSLSGSMATVLQFSVNASLKNEYDYGGEGYLCLERADGLETVEDAEIERMYAVCLLLPDLVVTATEGSDGASSSSYSMPDDCWDGIAIFTVTDSTRGFCVDVSEMLQTFELLEQQQQGGLPVDVSKRRNRDLSSGEGQEQQEMNFLLDIIVPGTEGQRDWFYSSLDTEGRQPVLIFPATEATLSPTSSPTSSPTIMPTTASPTLQPTPKIRSTASPVVVEDKGTISNAISPTTAPMMKATETPTSAVESGTNFSILTATPTTMTSTESVGSSASASRETILGRVFSSLSIVGMIVVLAL